MHPFNQIKAIYQNLFEKMEGSKAGLPGLGNTFFVDAASGSDSNTGLTPSKALLTIAQALSLCVDGHDDVIVVRGNFANAAVTITKSKVHLLGLLGKGPNQSWLSRINPPTLATGPTILIQAIDVEVAYLNVIGHRDLHYPAITADGEHTGTRSHIHDCYVSGIMTPDGTHYQNGIELYGDRHVVDHCIIHKQKVGILVNSGVQATYEIQIHHNIFSSCDVGVDIVSVQEAAGQHGSFVADNLFDAQGAAAEDRAIKVAGPGGTPMLARNLVAGYTTPFTNGGAKLVLNYNQAGGGTLLT